MASEQTLESMLVCTKAQEQEQEKKVRPPTAEQALKCPRCDSANTKFCYYNNYSLTQPRYFCKSCRRYWTKGGTLRNVPVGGGCRKSTKRSSSSSRRSSQENPLVTSNSKPMISSLAQLSSFDHNNSSTDLSLAFARLQKQTSNQEFDFDGNPSGNGLFDALRNGFLENPNFYYNGNFGNVENGGLGINLAEDMCFPYEELNGATTVKREIYNTNNVRSENENGVLWGFPWQTSGDSNMYDLDSGKQSWHNGFGSTWHGLLNGPLM